jgi:hypothetical protein
MGARLQYAKVIDREKFIIGGGKIHPGLSNQVVVNGEPGVAAAFLLLRGWTGEYGTFTEQWRIESPGGTAVYEGIPRELHIATRDHVERLEDEVADLKIDYAADDYRVVFTLDDREVARMDFPIGAQEQPEETEG